MKLLKSHALLPLALAAALAAHVANSGLAKQKIPERFEFVADFPRTASGKVRKDQLRAMAAQSGEEDG